MLKKKEIMKFYKFEYLPYDNYGDDSKKWRLYEVPKEWAEHDFDVLDVWPYYDNSNINCYHMELEALSPVKALAKAWSKVIKKIGTVELQSNYYLIEYGEFPDEDGEGEETDWEIRLLKQPTKELYRVYSTNCHYYIEVEDINPVKALNSAMIHINLFIARRKRREKISLSVSSPLGDSGLRGEHYGDEYRKLV